MNHLTNRGFTELLSSHFVGDVRSHEDADVNPHLLSDDIRDELQALWTLIDPLTDTETDTEGGEERRCAEKEVRRCDV